MKQIKSEDLELDAHRFLVRSPYTKPKLAPTRAWIRNIWPGNGKWLRRSYLCWKPSHPHPKFPSSTPWTMRHTSHCTHGSLPYKSGTTYQRRMDHAAGGILSSMVLSCGRILPLTLDSRCCFVFLIWTAASTVCEFRRCNINSLTVISRSSPQWRHASSPDVKKCHVTNQCVTLTSGSGSSSKSHKPLWSTRGMEVVFSLPQRWSCYGRNSQIAQQGEAL